MDDLIERLEDAAEVWEYEASHGGQTNEVEKLLREAAVELKRLRDRQS